MKGPDNHSYKRCAKCDWLHYTLGMCNLHAWCNHPRYNKKRTIGSYPRGADRGVPTPGWCPVLMEAVKAAKE